MIRRPLVLLAAAFLALAPSTRSATTDDVRLAWRLPKDSHYRVVSTLEQETTSTVQEQVQRESMSQRTTRLVTVDDVDEQGTMDLTVAIEALSMRKSSDTLTLTVSAGRNGKGELEVEVTVDSRVPSLDKQEFEKFFEAVIRNLLELRFDLRVTPRGRVLKSHANGNPFTSLPALTEAEQLASQVLQIMLSPEDLAQAVAAELFVQLPDQGVQVGDRWPVARELSVSGIRMVGSGESKLSSVDTTTGVALATIDEKLEYAVVTDGFEAKLANLMTRAYAQFGVNVEVGLDLRAEPLKAESTALFDPDAGYCLSVKRTDIKMPMSGTMTIGKQSVKMNMLVEMTNGSSSWTRLQAQ
ncbi:MAG: hypothetical protein KDC14_09130 [Planctomycetes bacterium]|nr:hypothetical protein [Planctomycetota bacterium]